MVTAQSQVLYAAAQSSQFLASEYCAELEVLHGICCSEYEKFCDRFLALSS